MLTTSESFTQLKKNVQGSQWLHRMYYLSKDTDQVTLVAYSVIFEAYIACVCLYMLIVPWQQNYL